MSVLELSVKPEQWELKEPFIISRGTRTYVDVLYIEFTDGTYIGRGETCPTPRYGGSIESETQKIEKLANSLPEDLTPELLQSLMPNGGARNGVDAALWDYLAKKTGKQVWEMLGLKAPKPVETVYTISLNTPEKMAVSAKKNAYRGFLKLKFGGNEDDRRASLVREAVGPDCRIVLDANESWTLDHLKDYLPVMAKNNILMVEQPLPQGQDEALGEVEHIVPICADESCHTREDLVGLKGLYEMVNIKLDKTGGLTEAALLFNEAKAMGFEIMVGCMLGTSLGMAPSHLVASHAKFVDLDAPLLIKADRVHGLKYDGNLVYPPEQEFWG
jgi:L-Ala-D/L-Glu epimerase